MGWKTWPEFCSLKLRRFLYLISPNIIDQRFYKDLREVLSSKKVKYFQLRLKRHSSSKLLKIAKKVKTITKKYKVKLIINDFPILAKKINADGCHLGQSDGSIKNAKNLNAINKINDTSFNFTFSYGRALQQSALKTWAKSMKDIDKIQKVFDHRAKMNGASTEAKWNEKLEQSFAA